MRKSFDLEGICISAALMLVGLYAAGHTLQYNIGTLRQPGPGAAPLAVALLMFALVAATLPAALRSSKIGREEISYRAAGFSIAGVVVWALTVKTIGLVAANAAAIALFELGNDEVRPVRAAITWVVTTTFSAVIFIKLLAIPLTLFGY